MYEKRKWKILIIDDDPLVLNSFLPLLNRDGYTAVGVSDAPSGLTLLEHDRFDIVLTELVMEEMGGDALLSAIFKMSPHIILMAITGYGSLQMAIQTIRHGAYYYILKPCDYHNLKMRIERAIKTMRALEGKKKDEDALRISEERYKILVENIQDLFLLFDKDKNCLYANLSWENQYGISLGSLVGKNWMEHFSPEDTQKIDKGIHALIKEGVARQEFVISLKVKENQERTFTCYMLSQQKSNTQRHLVFFFLHNITEHMKSQTQAREIERLRAAKYLAVATAHHINQPMTLYPGTYRGHTLLTTGRKGL